MSALEYQMERAVAAVGLEKREFGKGWAKAEWKLPEKGHLVRSKNAAGWESSVFLRFAHLYLCPCLSIFAYINVESNVVWTNINVSTS